MDDICKRLKGIGRCKPSDSCNGTGTPEGGIYCSEYMKEEKEEARRKYIASIPKRPKLIELKSDPEIFQMHWENRKNFDLRQIRERDFQDGDILLFREFDRKTQQYSGREIVLRVLSMVVGPIYDLPGENVIMSLHPITIKTEGGLKPRGEM